MRRIMNTFRKNGRETPAQTQPQNTAAARPAAPRPVTPPAPDEMLRPSPAVEPRAAVADNSAGRERQTSLRRQVNLDTELGTWRRQATLGEDRAEAARRIRQCDQHKEATLCLSHLRLRSLPAAIGTMGHLKTLELEHNNLVELPDSISELKQLDCLKLDHNQLPRLPDSLATLTQLRTLHADHNQLTELPQAMGAMTNLLDLQLQNNQIRRLPGNLSTLRKGTIVHLKNNAFSAARLDIIKARMGAPENRGPVIYLDQAADAPPAHLGVDIFPTLSPSKKIQALLESAANTADGWNAEPQNFNVGSRNMTKKECLLMALELALEHQKPLVPAISQRLLTDLPDDTAKFLILGVNFARERVVAWSRDQGLPVETGAARPVVEVKPILKAVSNAQNVHDSDVRGHFVEQFNLISARVARPVSVNDAVAGITGFLNSTRTSDNDVRVSSALRGLREVTIRDEAARGFALSPAQTLAVVWSHIENTDDELKILLRDALKNRLVEVGDKRVCALGLTERMIDIPTAVDWSVTHGISQEHLHVEIATMAGDINEEYEAMFGADADTHRAAAEAAGDTRQLGDIEERINTIKRDMFIAKAKVELALLRNLDETFVNDQIRNIFPSGEAMRVQM